MGASCKFYKCGRPATRYVRKPFWAERPASLVASAETVLERAHPMCDYHSLRVEQRYESKLFAHEDAEEAK